MQEKITCEYCGKKFSKRGIHTHVMRTHENSNKWDSQKTSKHSDKIKNGIKEKYPNGRPASNKGKKHSRSFFEKVEHPNSIIFVENSTYPRHRLKARVIRDKLIKHECQVCGNNGMWNNIPLTIQIDHINGINDDNRINNLRFLCPNCHSQTDTYAGKNSRRPKVLR